MIAQSIQHEWSPGNNAHSVIHQSEHLSQNTFVGSGSGSLVSGNSEYAAEASPKVLKQYLQGLRYLRRKKQRRCISEGLG